MTRRRTFPTTGVIEPCDAKTDVQLVVHHPRLGMALKERMDKLGIECVIQYPGQPGGERIEPLDFIKKHFERARRVRDGSFRAK